MARQNPRQEMPQTPAQQRQTPQTARRAKPVKAPVRPVIDRNIGISGAPYKDTGRIETPRPVKPKPTDR